MKDNLFLNRLGKKVSDIRKSKGISVRMLGEMCEIDYANISRFENGRQDIKMLTLKTIADKLEVDIKDFL
jgi:transcriptional regulator with XRE-family HTH domain